MGTREHHLTNRVDRSLLHIVDLDFGIPASHAKEWFVCVCLLGPAAGAVQRVCLSYWLISQVITDDTQD